MTCQLPPIVICRGGKKVRIIRGCHFDEFKPYRTRIVGEEDDEEIIENKMPEVIRK
jgi:hypothetical protein